MNALMACFCRVRTRLCMRACLHVRLLSPRPEESCGTAPRVLITLQKTQQKPVSGTTHAFAAQTGPLAMHSSRPSQELCRRRACVCVCVCVMLASSAAQERARLHAQWARAVHHLERARLAERIAPPAEQPSPGTRPCPAEGCEAGTVRAAGSLLAGRAACGHWSTCQVCSPGAR